MYPYSYPRTLPCTALLNTLSPSMARGSRASFVEGMALTDVENDADDLPANDRSLGPGAAAVA